MVNFLFFLFNFSSHGIFWNMATFKKNIGLSRGTKGRKIQITHCASLLREAVFLLGEHQSASAFQVHLTG